MFDGFGPAWLFIFELLFRLALICFVLLRGRSPMVTLAWIAVIMAVPLFGAILYLLVGEVRPGGRRVRRHRAIVERIQTSPPFVAAAASALRPVIDSRHQHLAVLAEAVGDNDPLGGNAMKLMADTDAFIQSVIEDIDQASLHCHVLTYIYLTDHSGTRVGEALMRASARGVACRVLADGLGSKLFLRSELRQRMEGAGVRVVEALPVNPLRLPFSRIDIRNHRKIVVIDGVIGYTGSQNIADASFAIKPRFAPWVDAGVRIEGPVTWDLQALFVQDWYLDTDESLEDLLTIMPLALRDEGSEGGEAGAGGVVAQVMGTGPNAYNTALRQLHQAAFHAAREELIVTTPYFVPDEPTLTALCTAARRGVETLLIVPARNDSRLVGAASRSNYETLLDSGVRIHEYKKGLLHVKTVTVDRDLALVSTANLDRRSFELNFEVSLVVYDDDFASQLRFLQTSYLNDCRQVDLRNWRRRGWPQRLWQNAAGTLSPLL